MFAFTPLFVDFFRYLTFWHHMIQIVMQVDFNSLPSFHRLVIMQAQQRSYWFLPSEKNLSTCNATKKQLLFHVFPIELSQTDTTT